MARKGKQDKKIIDPTGGIRSLRYSACKESAADIPSFSAGDPDLDKRLSEWLAVVVANASTSKKSPFSVDKVTEGDWVISINGIGSVNWKIPDARVSTPSSIFESSFTDHGIPVVCTGSTLIERPYVYVANAMQTPIAKFLLATCLIDGVATSPLSVAVHQRSSRLFSHLVNAGFTEELMDLVRDIFDTKKALQHELPIHPLTKQIFFCEEGADDIILAIGSDDGLLGEFNRRQEAAGWIPGKVRVMVSGMNPVNAGLVISEKGGLRVICAQAPIARFEPNERIAYAIRTGGRLYRPSFISDATVKRFLECVPETVVVQPFEKREAESASYRQVADDIASGIETIAANGESIPFAEIHDDHKDLFLSLGFCEDEVLPDARKESLAEKILSETFYEHPGLSKYMNAAAIFKRLRHELLNGVLA